MQRIWLNCKSSSTWAFTHSKVLTSAVLTSAHYRRSPLVQSSIEIPSKKLKWTFNWACENSIQWTLFVHYSRVIFRWRALGWISLEWGWSKVKREKVSKGKKTPKDKELLFYYLNNRMTKYQTVSKLPATLCFELWRITRYAG